MNGYTPRDPVGEPLCTLTLEQYDSIGGCILAQSGAPDLAYAVALAAAAIVAGVYIKVKGWNPR